MYSGLDGKLDGKLMHEVLSSHYKDIEEPVTSLFIDMRLLFSNSRKLFVGFAMAKKQ